MKKFLLVSFILCSIYGFSAKVNTSKNNTSVTENKNIGEMTIKKQLRNLAKVIRKNLKR